MARISLCFLSREIPRCKRNFVFREAFNDSKALLVFGRPNSGKLVVGVENIQVPC